MKRLNKNFDEYLSPSNLAELSTLILVTLKKSTLRRYG